VGNTSNYPPAARSSAYEAPNMTPPTKYRFQAKEANTAVTKVLLLI